RAPGTIGGPGGGIVVAALAGGIAEVRVVAGAEPADLFAVLAHVTNPEVAARGVDVEAPGVAQPEDVDFPRIRRVCRRTDCRPGSHRPPAPAARIRCPRRLRHRAHRSAGS